MFLFSADLTAIGKSADELKRSLNVDLSLNGENLMLYSIDIDALVMKYERSRNFTSWTRTSEYRTMRASSRL